jgi:hypothetical protein
MIARPPRLSGKIGKIHAVFENEKAWRGRRMRQALNLTDNWEEEDVVDPVSNNTGRRRCVVR